jgi:NitT/TauT family transport system substrate-binding protein
MSQLNLMALRHSAFYSPYLMTVAGGYLKRAGFNITYTVQTADKPVKDRLLNGQCHISQSAVAAGFDSLENNQADSIRHFAQINSRDGFFIAARKSTSSNGRKFNWHNLKGKSILLDHFFQPMAMFNYALFKNQLKLSDLNIIDAGDVLQIDQAFRKGTADFVHQQGPAPQQLEAEGIASVVASIGEAIGPVAFSSLCAISEWLKTDMAAEFFDIYKTALKYCQQSDASDIAKQLQNYGFLTGIDFNVLCTTINTYQKLGCWKHNGTIENTEYETLLDVFEYSQLITGRHRYASLIETI